MSIETYYHEAEKVFHNRIRDCHDPLRRDRPHETTEEAYKLGSTPQQTASLSGDHHTSIKVLLSKIIVMLPEYILVDNISHECSKYGADVYGLLRRSKAR